jgi:CRISP-associated protein Cas1
MRPLLNTLYVTTQGAYLARDGETVLVRVEQEVRLRVPIHTLSGIVCFGQVGASPFLLGFCAERSVAVSFLTEHGRFLARVQGPTSGNVLLRREQYRWADDPEKTATLSRAFVIGKVANSRTVLLRGARERGKVGDGDNLERAAARLGATIRDLENASTAETVRGLEGDAARNYFGVFNELVNSEDDEFRFHERSRRPPLDPVNALLSFVYTLLMHDIEGALEAVGLDRSVGFLHRDRPGRPGLALDLMEEFRAFMADRLVLTLINRRQVQSGQFRKSESGAVLLDDAGRKEVLQAFQRRKQEQLQHPFLGEQVPIGLLPFVQAMLLARHLRGDLQTYPPFLWR